MLNYFYKYIEMFESSRKIFVDTDAYAYYVGKILLRATLTISTISVIMLTVILTKFAPTMPRCRRTFTVTACRTARF